ncbi:Unknown protein [Striga hermonthica]|uniref:Pectinesterase inhibitor domain-containing protein n=1 Tax=Striga hermonthica TaxID=68872 RepID=A0A9N7NLY9_STRHE|nr:Unknown protein [Striga hermonthica]
MAADNTPRLLLLSISLLLSLHLARPHDLSPSPSPGSSSASAPVPSPSVELGPSPSPSPESGPGPSPSYAPSPNADGPAASAGPGPSPSYTDTDADKPSPSPSYLGTDDEDNTDEFGPAQFDLSLAPVPAADAGTEVKEICNSTDHPELCLDTLVPRLDGNYDIPIVLEVSMRVGADLARTGLSVAKKVVDGSVGPPELASVLRDCRDMYDEAVYNFESAIDAFPRRDKGTMSTMLSAVITDIGDCEDGLARFGDESPFTDVAEKVKNTASNCLAIVSLLH